MIAFTIIGIIVAALAALFLAALAWDIAGNLYGGIKGAYRMHAIMVRSGMKRAKHWQIVRFGLRAWTGKRYRDGGGFYWQTGGLIVPIDGRDPITHRHAG